MTTELFDLDCLSTSDTVFKPVQPYYVLAPPKGPAPGYLEYFMGLNRGELDCRTRLNVVDLRTDIGNLFNSSAWTLLPSEKTLKTLEDIHRYNAQNPNDRILYTEGLPIGEYEYEFVANNLSVPIFFRHPRTNVVIRFDEPYVNMPRFKSQTHPFFAVVQCRENLSYFKDHETFMVVRDRMVPITVLSLSWSLDTPKAFQGQYELIPAAGDSIRDDGTEDDDMENDSDDDSKDVNSVASCSTLPVPNDMLDTLSSRFHLDRSASTSWKSTVADWLHCSSDDLPERDLLNQSQLGEYGQENSRQLNDALEASRLKRLSTLTLSKRERDPGRANYSSNDWTYLASKIVLAGGS